MKIITSKIRLSVLVLMTVSVASGFLNAQKEEVIQITVHPRAVPANPDSIRLLPREHELRDGNAVIELLRMPWEQQNFMKLKGERMNDWLEMKGDDPEMIQYESAFLLFKDKMRRAAYTRDADWDYPIGEQPLVSILLPDVQGMRAFAGRVLTLWIRIQIAKGNLEGAEEGLLIQMACARHVSRTPFLVCHLVGTAIARIGFEQVESLIQEPESENLYYALAALPNSLGDFRAAVEMESTFIRGSIPVLAGGSLPPVGDLVWKKALDEMYEDFTSMYGSKKYTLDRDDVRRQAKIAAGELPALGEFTPDQIDKMSDEEKLLRWILLYTDRLGAKYIAVTQLPADKAIQKLVLLETEFKDVQKKVTFAPNLELPAGAERFPMLSICSVQSFMGCHRTGRGAKLLQIVEAIRDFASKNGNRLPDTLDEIDLELPLDPFTAKPAEYELKDGVAMLRWPLVSNLGEKLNYRRVYELRMSESK